MERLTTDDPQNNTETMLNMVFVKNEEVYLRGIDEDCTDISLVDYCKNEYKRLYGIEIEESDPCEFGEYMDDDSLLSVFYWACVGFAEVRERLIVYEDSNLTPADIKELTRAIARNLVAWDTSKDKKEGLLPEVYLTDRCLYKKLTGVEYNFSDACKRFSIGD